SKIERDGDGAIECKQKRHLNQQRQAPTKRIAFTHQLELVHLQLFQTRIVLLHPLHLLLQLFHPRRELLRFLHRLGRAPLEREEERVDDDGEQNNRDAVTAGGLEQVGDRLQDRNR